MNPRAENDPGELIAKKAVVMQVIELKILTFEFMIEPEQSSLQPPIPPSSHFSLPTTYPSPHIGTQLD